ncbi:hypothetical protein R6Q57_013375 [Mikania cordata]
MNKGSIVEDVCNETRENERISEDYIFNFKMELKKQFKEIVAWFFNHFGQLDGKPYPPIFPNGMEVDLLDLYLFVKLRGFMKILSTRSGKKLQSIWKKKMKNQNLTKAGLQTIKKREKRNRGKEKTQVNPKMIGRIDDDD